MAEGEVREALDAAPITISLSIRSALDTITSSSSAVR
jgi:hypothetical protein